MANFHNTIKERISAQALRTVTSPGAAVDTGLIDLETTTLEFNILQYSQIGLWFLSDADRALIASESDGSLLFTVQVEQYERIDKTSADVTAANVKRSSISTANLYKQDGELEANTALISAFDPDMIRIQVTVNVASLSEISITAMQ